MTSPKSPSPSSVQYFVTSRGGKIYQIPIEAFPGFWGYAYLVIVDDYVVLIDTGSGFGEASQQLEAGLHVVSGLSGQDVGLSNLTHIFITHGHIDHFGGLAYVRPRTSAKIGVHELDRRVLTNYEERLTIIARRLSNFLIDAGVSPERRENLLNLYLLTKSIFHSVNIDFTYEALGMKVGPFELLHVPGHCAGHVAIRLHDVLFSGDHILESTSPHQSPEHLTLSTGLDHYLRSLDALRSWANGVRLTLGGHKQPILDLPKRINEIHNLHMERLQKVLDLLEQPKTIAEVSHALFGEVSGYNVLLALEEAGAHVEYLDQRGLLEIGNLKELEVSYGQIPIRYCRL